MGNGVPGCGTLSSSGAYQALAESETLLARGFVSGLHGAHSWAKLSCKLRACELHVYTVAVEYLLTQH